MKKNHYYLFLFYLLFTFSINAQNFGRGQRGATAPPVTNTSSVSLKDVHEEVSKIVPICVTEFNLDDFEKEILKNYLTIKFESENNILLDDKIKGEDRRKRLYQIEKDFYSELTTIMTIEEIENYKALDFDEVEKENKKKNRKKKKKQKKNKN